MIELNADECRVLGVLVEKAFTTPGQYPLSLNATATGASQKSNRDPVMEFDEDRAYDALEGLRQKGLAIVVDMSSSRVLKYKHNARETLGVGSGELVVLAELLMRGPQTLGELRTRATRMHPIESLDVAGNLLDSLMSRDEPLVKRLPPAPGSRAERYAQLLCPDLHPLNAPATATAAPPAIAAADPALADRVAQLEAKVAELDQAVRTLLDALGGE